VTHRLSSIVDADRIFVMEGGHIVESGSHQELVDRGGAYASLWRKQTSFAVSDGGGRAVATVDRLRDISLLAPLGDHGLEALTRMFGTLNVRPGQVIVRQGDRNNELYIIVRGLMSVTAKGADGLIREVARLRDGEEFGELAFLFDMPRTATVTAVTEGLLLTLTRDRFYSLLSTTPEVRAEVERIAEERRLARTLAPAEPKSELPPVPILVEEPEPVFPKVTK